MISELLICLKELDVYLRSFDSFKEVWEVDRDVFLRRYEKRKPDAAAFSADITRYLIKDISRICLYLASIPTNTKNV